MNIIIGNPNDQKMLKIKSQIPGSIVTNTYCKLKHLSGLVTIVIPNAIIKENGFIQGTEISLDELLLKLKVQKIVYGNLANKEILNDYLHNYHVKTVYFAF